MITVVFVIHILIALAMVCLVLLQRSEGGALGMGGGGGGMMSSRSSANLLTRATAVLAGGFMLTSLGLTWLASGDKESTSILDQVGTPVAPIEAPAEPANPTVPIAQ
jgi:preprotein translocase subunit SecG